MTPSWSGQRTSSLCRRTISLRNSSSTSSISNCQRRRISNASLQNSARAGSFVFNRTTNNLEIRASKFCPPLLAQFLSNGRRNGRSLPLSFNRLQQTRTATLKAHPLSKRISHERATNLSHSGHCRELVWLPANLRRLQPHADFGGIWQWEIRAPRPHPVRNAW